MTEGGGSDLAAVREVQQCLSSADFQDALEAYESCALSNPPRPDLPKSAKRLRDAVARALSHLEDLKITRGEGSATTGSKTKKTRAEGIDVRSALEKARGRAVEAERLASAAHAEALESACAEAREDARRARAELQAALAPVCAASRGGAAPSAEDAAKEAMRAAGAGGGANAVSAALPWAAWPRPDGLRAAESEARAGAEERFERRWAEAVASEEKAEKEAAAAAAAAAATAAAATTAAATGTATSAATAATAPARSDAPDQGREETEILRRKDSTDLRLDERRKQLDAIRQRVREARLSSGRAGESADGPSAAGPGGDAGGSGDQTTQEKPAQRQQEGGSARRGSADSSVSISEPSSSSSSPSSPSGSAAAAAEASNSRESGAPASASRSSSGSSGSSQARWFGSGDAAGGGDASGEAGDGRGEDHEATLDEKLAAAEERMRAHDADAAMSGPSSQIGRSSGAAAGTAADADPKGTANETDSLTAEVGSAASTATGPSAAAGTVGTAGTAAAAATAPSMSASAARDLVEDARLRGKLIDGGMFLKHGRSGAPHKRIVYVSEDLSCVLWREAKKPRTKPGGSMAVSTVTGVIEGQTTLVFARRKGKAHREPFSFSLLAEDRTLDLECETIVERADWIRAFNWLIKNSGKP